MIYESENTVRQIFTESLLCDFGNNLLHGFSLLSLLTRIVIANIIRECSRQDLLIVFYTSQYYKTVLK